MGASATNETSQPAWFIRIPVFFGGLLFAFVRSVGQAFLFGIAALISGFSIPKISRHVVEIGVRTLPLVILVGFFTGMVLGLQGYYALSRFGSESLIGSMVALTIIREIGPVLAAIMVVGQAGSALAAEIGMQRNSEQIDALKIMGINPLAFLIGPRLIAAVISYPILTGMFDLVGIIGGQVSSVYILGIDQGVFWANARGGVEMSDLYGSLLKGAVFGMVTILVCCFEGFHSTTRSWARGARGVSESATRAVVISSILILITDYLITSFLII